MAIQLKAVTVDDFFASAGKFRALIVVDSEPYQINEDVETLEVAIQLCSLAQRSPNDLVQIFNDQGRRYIFDGVVDGKGR